MNINFEIEKSKIINGVWIIKPSISRDSRGNIWTSFLKDEVEKLLPDGLYFKHDKFSESRHNVLRGIHGDRKTWKLVTCVFGEIQQVVVDLRESSSTFMKWEKFVINKFESCINLSMFELNNNLELGKSLNRFLYTLLSISSFVRIFKVKFILSMFLKMNFNFLIVSIN